VLPSLLQIGSSWVFFLSGLCGFIKVRFSTRKTIFEKSSAPLMSFIVKMFQGFFRVYHLIRQPLVILLTGNVLSNIMNM